MMFSSLSMKEANSSESTPGMVPADAAGAAAAGAAAASGALEEGLRAAAVMRTAYPERMAPATVRRWRIRRANGRKRREIYGD